MALTKIGASLGGGADTISVTQNDHGLSIGYPVKVSGNGTFAHATADSEANADAVGIIIESTTNTMLIALSGKVTVDAALPSGNVAAGTVLYLPVSAGKLTATEPTGNTQISKPMAVVSYLNSEMILINYRGEVISTAGVAIADNAITLAKMAHGTDGNLITYDTSGAPAYVATGNDGQVLTSAGANNPPAFETLSTGATVKVGFFEWDTTNSAGNQTISNIGFQPSAIIFEAIITNSRFYAHGFWGANYDNDNVTTYQTTAGGSTTNSTSTRVAHHRRDALDGDSTPRRNPRNDRIIFGWPSSSSSVWIQGDLGSVNSDGFVMAWTKSGSPTGVITCNFLAFK